MDGSSQVPRFRGSEVPGFGVQLNLGTWNLEPRNPEPRTRNPGTPEPRYLGTLILFARRNGNAGLDVFFRPAGSQTLASARQNFIALDHLVQRCRFDMQELGGL